MREEVADGLDIGNDFRMNGQLSGDGPHKQRTRSTPTLAELATDAGCLAEGGDRPYL
ncbi:hypothetical protein PPMP20_09525 [Paraburkholderia phymatum]|uniref:hypothetical protein n=1 Tax=Paraburkholderia phymatum TaxID=148447 RepID=UPI00142EEA4C|nr:hypothetical protein [Paraburkholderia phymatum]